MIRTELRTTKVVFSVVFTKEVVTEKVKTLRGCYYYNET